MTRQRWSVGDWVALLVALAVVGAVVAAIGAAYWGRS